MLPSTTRWSLPVVLTSQQGAALTDILARQPDTTFRVGVALGEVAALVGRTGQVWRAGRPQPEALRDKQDLDAGVVLASSLRDMPTTEPSSWPPPAALSISACWSWQINAPTVPNGAADDPLVKAWRTVDRRYATRIESALAVLADIEKKQSTLERAFATLKGALLGFARSRTGLRASLQAAATGKTIGRWPGRCS